VAGSGARSRVEVGESSGAQGSKMRTEFSQDVHERRIWPCRFGAVATGGGRFSGAQCRERGHHAVIG
jgi:hypothetical protein